MKKRKIRYDRLVLVILLLLSVFTGIISLFRILKRGNVIHILPEKKNDRDHPDLMENREEMFLWIEVSYLEQKLYCYEGDELLFTSDIVTGNESTEIIPYGTYHVLYMTEDATLVGEDYEKHVDYWIGFDLETGGHMVGFHDASWRSVFGGNEWKTNPTLECINMPTDKVRQLYETVDIGTEIRIHD